MVCALLPDCRRGCNSDECFIVCIGRLIYINPYHNLEREFSAETDFEQGYVINVDKPLGWTSTDVVRKIKFLLRKRGYKKIKVGHAGTLDPLATGVLLVCVGRATKRVDELQGQAKQYVTDIRLGATTPSFDLEHPIDKTWPCDHISREMVYGALGELCGERLQTPPVYSAKKIDGLRAYEYAREGTEVQMRRALINIYSMELLDFQSPYAKVRIDCSKGTYIRSIAMELGELLECGAHLTSLRRTRSGDFTVDNAYTMEQVEGILKVEERAAD